MIKSQTNRVTQQKLIGMAVGERKPVKREKGVYFTDIEAFRRAITPKRLELLRTVRREKPSSVRQLSEITKRDVKNVSTDIKFPEQAGLVDTERGYGEKKELAPSVSYDKILFEIAVS